MERRPRLCTLTTAVAAGAFRLQFDNQEELRLVRESVELFLSFKEITQQIQYDLGIRRQGYLWLTTSPERAERQRRLVEQQRAWGLTDVELLAGDEARQRFPFVAERVLQARFRAADGFLDPKALTLGLAFGSGAQVATSCAVTGFRVTGGRLAGVETNCGFVATETAVIAVGPFSGVLARTAGVELPVEIVTRQKVVMPDVPEVPQSAPMVIDDDTGTHWRPIFQGASLLFADPATPPSEPAENVPLDHRFAFRLLDPASPVGATRVVPLWQKVWDRSVAPWVLQAGQYTVTPDHRPVVGATAISGLWVNTGYSGHGVMAGPAASRLLVDLLTGRVAAEDNPFRLDRVFSRRDRDVL